MRVILVPGLWLTGSSWDAQVAALEAAGHEPSALTMPGVGEPRVLSEPITLSDWVAAVCARIDDAAEPVVLVGHSGGAHVVYGAADARPHRVAHLVCVDAFPPPPDATIGEFPVLDGVVPFPGWGYFDDADTADLDHEMRAALTDQLHTVPARIPTDPITLTNVARRSIPATVISATLSTAQVREALASDAPELAEVAAHHDVSIVDMRSDAAFGGHWPQFSRPRALSRALIDILDRVSVNA